MKRDDLKKAMEALGGNINQPFNVEAIEQVRKTKRKVHKAVGYEVKEMIEILSMALSIPTDKLDTAIMSTLAFLVQNEFITLTNKEEE